MPEEGETLQGSDLSVGPGGKGSNQAIGAARLGAQVSLLTAIGSDTFGDDALSLWEAEAVDSTAVKRSTAATMVGFILVEPDGANRICIAGGALDTLAPEDLDAFDDVVARADLLATGLEIPVDTAVEALRRARRHGVPTLLDPAPAAPIPDEAWELLDHLTPNRGEASRLLGAPADTSDEELLDGLRTRTDAVIVLTLGGDGLIVDVEGQREHLPPLPAERVVDTTGAGDAFAAAYAHAIADGHDPLTAARYGAAAGAHAVTIEEVVPSLPRPADLAPLPLAATEGRTR